MFRGSLALGAPVSTVSLLVLLTASAASAAFNPPTFARQWEIATTGPPDFNAAGGIAVDPFGDVYVLKDIGGGSARIFKYRFDGSPVTGEWTSPVSGASFGGIASDAQGHIFIGQGSRLREFTSRGVLLDDFQPPGFSSPPLAIDGAGNVYSDGVTGGGQHTINEYALSGSDYKLVGSANYPGTPNGGFFPFGFVGITLDPDGNVYASGVSTTDRFLAKFAPGLSGSISYLEDCTDPAQCFGGFGVAFAITGGETGTQPTVYAAGAYGDHNSNNFFRVGVYGTTPGPPGTSQYLGSYDQEPVPGGAFTNVGQLAASPCHAAIYEIVNAFGGPNDTINDQFVQQFDTHAPPTPCATSTTTTTLPCTGARCTFDAALTSPACAGEAIPGSVTKKFDQAVGLIAQAESSPARQARKQLKRAKKVLKRAKAQAARAAKGRKSKISSECAAVLRNAAESVAEGLGAEERTDKGGIRPDLLLIASTTPPVAP